MKGRIARVLIISVAVLFFLISRGMRINPHEEDQIAGTMLHFITAVLVFYFLFQRSGTAYAPPDFAKHYRVIGLSFVLVGAITVVSSLLVANFNVAYGNILESVGTRYFGAVGQFVAAGLAIAYIIVGVGVICRQQWSYLPAKVLAFPLSVGWPIGLGLALYVWWVLAPSKEPVVTA